MKWYPFSKKVVDERIENVRNKIYKEAYYLIIIICIVSMVIKNIIFGRSMDHVMTEFTIALASSIYMGIRSVMLGLYSDTVEIHDRTSKFTMTSKGMMINAAVGVGLGLVFGTVNSLIYADGLWETLKFFVLIFFVTIMFYVPVFIVVQLVLHSLAMKISSRRAREAELTDGE